MMGFLIGILHRTGDYVKVRWVKTRDTNGRNEKRMEVYFEKKKRNIYVCVCVWIWEANIKLE